MAPGYHSWPSLRELSIVEPLAGPSEQRGFSLIKDNPDELARQMRDYFNPNIVNKVLTGKYPQLMTDGPRYKAAKTRERLLDKLVFSEKKIVSYPFKPFDLRWIYLDELRPMIKEPASELQTLSTIPGNAFLIVCEPNDRATEGLSAWFSPFICDYVFSPIQHDIFRYISTNNRYAANTINLSHLTFPVSPVTMSIPSLNQKQNMMMYRLRNASGITY